jgi:NAD(P)H-dependent nitrite reductase small subunit
MTLTESPAARLTDASAVLSDAAAAAAAVPAARGTWTSICPLAQLEPLWGEAVLLPGGAQAALFLLPDGRLFATDNFDAEAGAMVMSRGLVGTRTVDGVARPTIASPLHKDVYDLETGRCYTNADLTLSTLPVRISAGVVELALS